MGQRRVGETHRPPGGHRSHMSVRAHVREKIALTATILHLLGFDHEHLTYRYAGRDFRLTDVHGTVVKDILA
jgi:hypothetical protein